MDGIAEMVDNFTPSQVIFDHSRVEHVKKSQKNRSGETEASQLMLSPIPGRTGEAKNRGSKTYKSDKEKTYVEEEVEYVHAAKKNEKKTYCEHSV